MHAALIIYADRKALEERPAKHMVGSGAGVPVSVLPTAWRRLFPYSHLNMMQSECFDEVFGSDRSMVIASPTGSGKTAVLELAITRLFTSSDRASRALTVYMAPLKALVHERSADWSAKLASLNLTVVELTGDSADEASDEAAVLRADLIVTTPEKWDSFSRFRRDAQGVIGRVSLLLVDEVHALVDEHRGPTLEAVISRMKAISQGNDVKGMPISALRIIAASATVSNVEDIASWLGPHCVAKQFDDSYRPVPLQWRVMTYPMVATYTFDKSLISQLFAVIRGNSSGRPSLVFCNSRKVCQQAAQHIATSSPAAKLVPNHAHASYLAQAASRMKHKGLAAMVRSGVGYHDASLELEDRRALENLFLEGMFAPEALPLACPGSQCSSLPFPLMSSIRRAPLDGQGRSQSLRAHPDSPKGSIYQRASSSS